MKLTIIETLQKLIELYPYKEEVQYDDYFGFEKNYRNAIINKELFSRVDYLQKWKENIGKNVYKSVLGFNYILSDEKISVLEEKRFDFSNKLVFTQAMFDKLEKDYISYQVDYLSNNLINNSLYENSTNQLSNIMFCWRKECSQKLIQLFKDIQQ